MTDADEERIANVHCVVCSAMFVCDCNEWDARPQDDRWRCPACIEQGRHLRWMTGVDSEVFTAALGLIYSRRRVAYAAI